MIVAVALMVIVVVSALAILELTRQPTAAPVGVVWYLWYGGPSSAGLGTAGWNSSSYPGGGSVVDRPAIGHYASDSNQTFAWQIGQMQEAGISFAVVSWWGPYTTGESGAINNATRGLFRYLKAADSSFKVAILVDAYNQTHDLSNSSLEADYSYVYSSFVKPFGPWYFEWHGKPLLLFFNPVQPIYLDASYSVRTVGNRPNPVNWTFWDAPTQYFSSQNGTQVNATNDEGPPVIAQDGEVTIVPRIDSYYQAKFGYSDSYLRFDPTLVTGLYQEQWNFVIANKADVKLVLIYSWNEYHERTEIEPHHDATAQVNDTYLLEMTAHYITKL